LSKPFPFSPPARRKALRQAQGERSLSPIPRLKR
jgi:hypothetical protein